MIILFRAQFLGEERSARILRHQVFSSHAFPGSCFYFDFCRNLISNAVSGCFYFLFIYSYSSIIFCDIYVFAFVCLLCVEVSEYAYDDHVQDDAKATEKDTALRVALSELSGEFGKESMLSLQRFFGARRAPVISTGSLRLDQALGVGGLPKVSFL